MRITVPKSTLDAALGPISKMAAAARLPSGHRPTLTFWMRRSEAWLKCALPDEQIALSLPDADIAAQDACFHVGLEEFARLLSTTKEDVVTIEIEGTRLTASAIDDSPIGSLEGRLDAQDAFMTLPKERDLTLLPTNFADFVMQAFTCADTDRTRLAMTGVNVSPRGIAATDGRQLFHLPLPLKLKSDVTLPPSKCLAALKVRRWTSLSHWRTEGNARMFAIVGDGFVYSAKALDAAYPDYARLIPPEGAGDVSFTLAPDKAKAAAAFLGTLGKDAVVELSFAQDCIILAETDGSAKGRQSMFPALCKAARLPHRVLVGACYLRQFLKMGFLTLSTSLKSPAPLVSSSGTGKYMFMPRMDTRGSQAPEKTAVEEKPQTKKEKQTMTATNEQTANATAIQPAANPLDETLAAIAAMREQISRLEERLLEAGRKIKAALIEQRQKERLYADANRRLERIRLNV